MNSTRTSLTKPRNERGAVLVMATLFLLVMLVMAAIAIDLANARQSRRQAQGSADAAALAGAQDLPDPTKVVATVKDYVLTNYGIPLADWIGCSDPSPLVQTIDSANSNTCISADAAYQRVRVTLPQKQVETFFAGVIGLDNIDVSASAEALAKLTKNNRVIPATVAASSGTGNLCIENGGNNADCASRNSGNFGSFDSWRMNIYKPTSSVSGNSLRINYSMGVDHDLSIYGSGSKVCDISTLNGGTSPCTLANAPAVNANHLIPFTGNDIPPLTDGVIINADISTDAGTKTFCGRLRRPDLDDDNVTETDPGYLLDGVNQPCKWWDQAGPGPAVDLLGVKINGRHVDYWLLPTYRTLFYGAAAYMTEPTQTGTAGAFNSGIWGAGDTKLECFLKSYRFNYTTQKEFFIDPTKAIAVNGDGTAFDPDPVINRTKAIAYLSTTCGLDVTTVTTKVNSGGGKGVGFWPMFDEDMAADPRFGMIPAIKTWSNGGGSPLEIERFWGQYMYRLYTSGANATKLVAIDAWVFEPALIKTPTGVADIQFGYQSKSSLIYLSK